MHTKAHPLALSAPPTLHMQVPESASLKVGAMWFAGLLWDLSYSWQLTGVLRLAKDFGVLISALWIVWDALERSKLNRRAKAACQRSPAEKQFPQRCCRPTSVGSKYVRPQDAQAWPRIARPPRHTS